MINAVGHINLHKYRMRPNIIDLKVKAGNGKRT